MGVRFIIVTLYVLSIISFNQRMGLLIKIMCKLCQPGVQRNTCGNQSMLLPNNMIWASRFLGSSVRFHRMIGLALGASSGLIIWVILRSNII
jgi:hypothetical protein